MGTEITVYSKAQKDVLLQTKEPQILLTESSIVYIHLNREMIDTIERVGFSALLTFKNGEVITVDNFFNAGDGAPTNSLVFDNDQGYWLAQYTNHEGALVLDYQPIESLDKAHHVSDEGLIPWPWALGGIVTASTAAIYHSNNKSDHKEQADHKAILASKESTTSAPIIATQEGGAELNSKVLADQNTNATNHGTFDSSTANDVFVGGVATETLVYHVLNAADALGGNGTDTWSHFHVGNTANTSADVIDISELLNTSVTSGNIGDYVQLTQQDTTHYTLNIDRDGSEHAYSNASLLHLQLDAVPVTGALTLHDLLQNHQLMI